MRMFFVEAETGKPIFYKEQVTYNSNRCWKQGGMFFFYFLHVHIFSKFVQVIIIFTSFLQVGGGGWTKKIIKLYVHVVQKPIWN